MCKCQECGLMYSVDIIVPNDVWKQILTRPETEESGLLCPKCIGDKLEKISGYASYKLVEI